MYSLQALQARQKSNQKLSQTVTLAAVGTILAAGTWVVLFTTGAITLGGVPYRVLMKVWQNDVARSALLSGSGRELHDVMDEMGIEYSIKAYYRPRIQDPVKLDQHIHQILYDRTGYVGDSYRLQGRTLVLKDPAKAQELRSCPSC